MNAKEHIKKASRLMSNVPDDYGAMMHMTATAVEAASAAAQAHVAIAKLMLEHTEVTSERRV
jgi:hypothetical protein